MKLQKKQHKMLFLIVNCILVLLFLICGILFRSVSGKLDSIHTAERWRGNNEMRFAQLACFLPVDDLKKKDDILQFRSVLNQKLIDASLETKEGTTLYKDAYSGKGTISVSGPHGSVSVKTIGVGGDFFLFHPLRLRSGSYLSESDLQQDRVILDEVTAWQLFGGYDVAGMDVTINDVPYFVAGVIRREDDFATQEAYLDGPGMFMSYDSFYKLTEGEISCYEIVMPDMISGFAKNIVSEAFSVGTGTIVENSNRYSLENLISVIKDFGLRSMRNNGVIYPYWENAVRLTEDYLALLLVLMFLFALCPAISILVIVVRTVIHGYRDLRRSVPGKFEAVREQKREKNYAKVGK